MEPYADSVDAEPVFGRPTALSVSDDNGIGDEPALAFRSEAMVAVCTLVHVSAAAITGIGLARVWRRMATNRFRFEFSSVMPWLAAAMVLHGLYNLGAFVFEWFGKCNAFGCSLSHW